ncbi:MAG: PP2C family protein-serine/threonine phosphatase [Gammaproteobacteria bacterium]
MKILIVEDERITRRNLQRQLEKWGHEVVAAADGEEAWGLLENDQIQLVITDWVMPELDGIGLVKRIRSRTQGHYVYLILLTSKAEKNDIVEGIEAGADDFLSKPFDRNELNARLRAGIRVIELEQNLDQRNREIGLAHELLKKDLAAGADYVMSLIPDSDLNPVMFDWRYIPSSDLGGDSFGYHRIDEHRVALYLVDVTGHGLDSALLSVSVINVLRSGSLPDTDFGDPGAVLYALNERFQGPEQGGKLFTIWYGVIDTEQSELKWAGGGHPDALLYHSNSQQPVLLPSTGVMIGVLRGQDFETLRTPLSSDARIYMYSDGVYEITQASGKIWSQPELVQFLNGISADEPALLDTVLQQVRHLRGSSALEDDFTIVEAVIRSDD